MKDLFLRTLAVGLLIAILLLGAWGIIQLAFWFGDGFPKYTPPSCEQLSNVAVRDLPARCIKYYENSTGNI